MAAYRRLFMAAIIVLSAVVAAGCGVNRVEAEAPAKGPEAVSAEQRYKVISETKVYQVIMLLDAKQGEDGYIVRIYDDEKKVVYETNIPKVNAYEPRIKIIDENIVEIRQGRGTGVWRSYYYDRKNNQVSRIYESPLLAGNGKVVIPKIGKIAVSDIFDRNVYYKEIAIEDFPPVANPVDAFKEIKWIGADKLSVTYKAGKKGEEWRIKTVVLDLNEK